MDVNIPEVCDRSLVHRKGEVKEATGNSCSPLIRSIQMQLSIVHMQADEQQRAWHESAINILTRALSLPAVLLSLREASFLSLITLPLLQSSDEGHPKTGVGRLIKK